MKIVVLGLGISGKAAALYLRNRGNHVLGVDRLIQQFEDIEVIADTAAIVLQGVDLIIKSPGIPYTHAWIEAASALQIPILGEIDLALHELSKKNKTIFGITGSNGKTTTTLMAAHLINANGKKAVAAGNIGIPLIAQIESDADVYVVELSSFQLEKIVEGSVLDAAAILNITPNHLDRHSSFEEYCAAKFRIALCLKKNAPLLVNTEVAKICKYPCQIYDSLKEKVETILPIGYRDSLYPHDLENITAAYALTRVSVEILKAGMETFVKPPHRLEHVCTVSGVNYINDSKATSVDAVIKAVQAINSPIILIAGGVDKGGDFRDWIPYFREKIIKIFALGPAATRIAKEIGSDIVVDQIPSLQEGVNRAFKVARAGDTVLLSPGCASYDQFRDYQHRGEVFKELVKEKL